MTETKAMEQIPDKNSAPNRLFYMGKLSKVYTKHEVLL